MHFPTSPAPHISSENNVGRVMRRVLYAFGPGAIAYTLYFGWGLLIHFVIAAVCALLLEAFALHLRNQPVLPFLKDSSAMVTAALFAFSISPLVSVWLVVFGMSFAIIVGKHL